MSLEEKWQEYCRDNAIGEAGETEHLIELEKRAFYAGAEARHAFELPSGPPTDLEALVMPGFDLDGDEIVAARGNETPHFKITGENLLKIALRHRKTVAGYQFSDKFDFDAIAAEIQDEINQFRSVPA